MQSDQRSRPPVLAYYMTVLVNDNEYFSSNFPPTTHSTVLEIPSIDSKTLVLSMSAMNVLGNSTSTGVIIPIGSFKNVFVPHATTFSYLPGNDSTITATSTTTTTTAASKTSSMIVPTMIISSSQ